MKVSKRPIDPSSKHFTVVVQIYERGGEGIELTENIPAQSKEQALRRAGMRMAHRLRVKNSR